MKEGRRPRSTHLSLVVIYMFCSLINSGFGQQSCNTPNNEPGICVPIQNCEELFNILNDRYRSPAETRFIRNSLCGRSQGAASVCCRQETSCTTPENTPGRCVPLQDCPHLKALEKTNQLQRSACRGSKPNSVCCGSAPVTETSTTVTGDGPGTDTRFGDDLLPTGDGCGLDESDNRILGGVETDVGQYPWMVLVEYLTARRTIALSCGGSLISKRYVLTAAHCVTGAVLTRVGRPINIRLGEHDKTTGIDCRKIRKESICNEAPVIIPIESTIPHAQYKSNEATSQNDIALIRLASDAPYTDFIHPICLPKSNVNQDAIAKSFSVAGWGATENGTSSNFKLHVNMKKVPLNVCQVVYSKPPFVASLWEGQLCLGGLKGKDSCNGDSGGPAMATEGIHWTLYGVISFGPKVCGTENVPGVCSNVFTYLDWIKKNIKP